MMTTKAKRFDAIATNSYMPTCIHRENFCRKVQAQPPWKFAHGDLIVLSHPKTIVS
jgi:hypothetical protein